MAGVEHKSSVSPTGRCRINGATHLFDKTEEHHRGFDVFFDCLGFENVTVRMLLKCFLHPLLELMRRTLPNAPLIISELPILGTIEHCWQYNKREHMI